MQGQVMERQKWAKYSIIHIENSPQNVKLRGEGRTREMIGSENDKTMFCACTNQSKGNSITFITNKKEINKRIQVYAVYKQFPLNVKADGLKEKDKDTTLTPKEGWTSCINIKQTRKTIRSN